LRALSPTGLLTSPCFSARNRAGLTQKTWTPQKVPVRNRLHGKTLMDRRQRRGRTAPTYCRPRFTRGLFSWRNESREACLNPGSVAWSCFDA
jgi:hypothetical protein